MVFYFIIVLVTLAAAAGVAVLVEGALFTSRSSSECESTECCKGRQSV